jgi:deoxyadenosine/deoxycytidine kinase
LIRLKPNHIVITLLGNMPVIVSIEGNIGSGKSTFIKHIGNVCDKDDIVIVPEPVREWESIKDSDGKSMLSYFYEDQERNAFSFQMMAYISRLAGIKRAIQNNPKAKLIITERCLETDRNVFAKMLHHDKKIRDIDYQIYEKWFDEFGMSCRPDYYVYIKASAEVCSVRIKMRSREGEDGIPVEYLQSCGKYHDDWIENKTNVYICNGHLTKEEGHPKWLKHIYDILHSKTTTIVESITGINYII